MFPWKHVSKTLTDMWWKLNSSGFYTFESLDLRIAWESYSVTTSSSLEFISPLERLVLFLTSYFFRFQEWCAFYQAERSYHGVRGSTYPSPSPGMNYGILQKFPYYPGTWDGFWKARFEGRAFAPYSEFQFSSVQSLSHVRLLATPWSQHARPPCPSPTPRVYPNPCPLCQWCHLTISSSVIPFSCPHSFPASGSFQMSQFFPSGGQSIGVSASTSVLPMNTHDWSPFG